MGDPRLDFYSRLSVLAAAVVMMVVVMVMVMLAAALRAFLMATCMARNRGVGAFAVGQISGMGTGRSGHGHYCG
jgi:hypothetical protein